MVCRTMYSMAFCAMSAAQDVFLEPVEPAKTSSVSVLARKPAQNNFEAQCASDNDHGWPRFQTMDELLASPWRSYFMEVYGELPSEYPVCINDLWCLNPAAYEAAGITGHEPVSATDVQEGDLFVGGLGLQIYHEVYEPLLANTWTEIDHMVLPSELKGFWVWRARGSGIWANSGNTIVFPQPADASQTHAEAIAFLRDGCSVSISAAWPRQESDIFGSCAREKGYDSIQFEPQEGQTPMGSFGSVGLTEMVLVNSDGHNTCGTDDASQTEFQSGWLASRQCDCENTAIPDACGLMPRAPFPISIIGANPPLCELQHRKFWRNCDPTACLKSTCKLPTSK